jgi:hypothetical protein
LDPDHVVDLKVRVRSNHIGGALLLALAGDLAGEIDLGSDDLFPTCLTKNKG